ncbi:MAG: hypothetical protein VX083_16255 [Pseudomonadota bacterium]|jgi:hypothetical protein|nr:hypothetical protein [Pseudomonadota bacterium]MEC8295044.1 hypothetical protein [Pseudomonadota bacterium]
MLASAASRYDTHRMPLWEVLLRMVVGLALIHPDPFVSGPALGAAFGLAMIHRMMLKSRVEA